MNLLFVIPSYNGGGAEAVTIKLANYLSESHKVTVFIIRPSGHHRGSIKQNVKTIESISKKSIFAWLELLILCNKTNFDKIYATLVIPIIICGFLKWAGLVKARFIARPANNVEAEKIHGNTIFKLYKFFLKKYDAHIAQNNIIQSYY